MGIIPARGGSKGIPHKNLAICGGKPLVDWTIDAANQATSITTAVLSSDSEGILSRANGKVQGLLRPEQFATDGALQEDVIDHVLENTSMPSDGIIVLLQPTSPLRKAVHIDEAVEMLTMSGAHSVVSVVASHALLWHGETFEPDALYPVQKRPNRQQMRLQWEENGAIYAFTLASWLMYHNRIGKRRILYAMSDEHRLQVDGLHELAWAHMSLLKPEEE